MPLLINSQAIDEKSSSSLYSLVISNESILSQSKLLLSQSPVTLLNKKILYTHQREYVLANIDKVCYAGSADATTCVIVIIVNKSDNLVAVTHLDSDKEEIIGTAEKLEQPGTVANIIYQLTNRNMNNEQTPSLDIHIVGGFAVDTNQDKAKQTASDSNTNQTPLESTLTTQALLQLFSSIPKIQLNVVTCLVGSMNTQYKTTSIEQSLICQQLKRPIADTYPAPIITSIYYNCETHELLANPVVKREDRGPAMNIRCLNTSVGASELTTIYNTEEDCYQLKPFDFEVPSKKYIKNLIGLPPNFLVYFTSTSPLCEPSDFIPDILSSYNTMLSFRNSTELFESTDNNNLNIADYIWIRKTEIGPECNQWIPTAPSDSEFDSEEDNETKEIIQETEENDENMEQIEENNNEETANENEIDGGEDQNNEIRNETLHENDVS